MLLDAVVLACKAVVPVVDPSSKVVYLSFDVGDPSFELLVSQFVLEESIDVDVTSPPVCCEIGMSTAGSAKCILN